MARHRALAALAGALALLVAPADAQTWHFDSALGVRETATNNVNLQPTDQREGDFVSEITPTLHIRGQGTRSSLDATVSVPVLFYARTGAENNTIYPSGNVVGNVDLVDNFLHLEGAINVAQQFFSPFGAQPVDFSNSTQNRYRTDTYRITPYIKGVTQGNIAYELRNNNVWTNLSGAPITTNNSYFTQWTGKAENTQSRLGWSVFYDYTNVRFNDENSIQNSIVTQLVRLRPIWKADPQLRLTASVGYEENKYTLTSSRDTIYGVGLQWNPMPRTEVVGYWEHRFFGGSYLFTFDHVTPLSVWKLQASRNITTYPQQLGTLPAGQDISSLVNSLFRARIPDPAERERAVTQFINDRGLPSVLAQPVSLYAQQIILEQLVTATAGLIGARNSIFFTLFNVQSQAISGAGAALPPQLLSENNNRQTGGNLAWTHNLTPSLTLIASVDASQTVANAPLTGKTNQGNARVALSMPLSAQTTAFAGARYQTFSSNVSPDYNETAVFVGVTHSFR